MWRRGSWLQSGCWRAWPRAAAAQTDSAAPRTPWGDPDLQGIWGAGYIVTPLERPAQYEGREFLTEEEVAALEGRAAGPGRDARATPGSVADVEGAYNDAYSGRGRQVIRTRRTSLIVRPAGRRKNPVHAGRPRAVGCRTSRGRPEIRDRAHHPEDQQDDRCEGITLPLQYGSARISGGHSRIVQGPVLVSFYYESGHQGGQYRDGLSGRPASRWRRTSASGSAAPPAGGRATRSSSRRPNFSDRTSFHGSRENLRLVERFTRTEPDLLMYRVVIEDPGTFASPWTIEVPLHRLDNRANQIYESACQEGNYALTSILAWGARPGTGRGRPLRR